MGRIIVLIFAVVFICGIALTGYLNADDKAGATVKQEQNQQVGKEVSEGSGSSSKSGHNKPEHKSSKEGETKEGSKDKSGQDDDDVYKNL